MSLLSPFSPFSPGEGVGSKALTHQQVPFSPFISSLSSQLPLFLFSSLLSAPLFSILLHCLFTSSPLHCFPLPQFVFLFLSHCLFFSFSFLDLHPLVLSSPIILFFCLIIAVILYPCPLSSPCLFISPLPIFPLSSHAFSSHTPSSLLLLILHCCLSTLHFPVSFSLFSLFFSFLPFTVSVFLPSICFSLLINLCSPCFQSTSWKVEGKEGRRGGGGGWKQGSLEPEGQLILIRLQPAY